MWASTLRIDMGTPGVPFNIPRKRILESIKAKKGVVTQICADLGIAYDTYYKNIKSNAEYKEAIDNARNDYDTTICDMAETALMRALNQKEDLSASLSSAKFVLNNKGKSRGYSAIPAQQNNDLDVNVLLKGIKGVLGDEGSESVSGSGVEAQQSVSDCKPKRRVNKVSAKRSSKKRL